MIFKRISKALELDMLIQSSPCNGKLTLLPTQTWNWSTVLAANEFMFHELKLMVCVCVVWKAFEALLSLPRNTPLIRLCHYVWEQMKHHRNDFSPLSRFWLMWPLLNDIYWRSRVEWGWSWISFCFALRNISIEAIKIQMRNKIFTCGTSLSRVDLHRFDCSMAGKQHVTHSWMEDY